MSTCVANIVSSWILPTFCWPLKEIASTLTWISPRLTDTDSPRGIHKSLAFLILYSFPSLLFSFAPLLLVSFLPELVLVTHLSMRHQAFPFVWQTSASNVWWSNLPQMCKTWLIREMSATLGGESESADDREERSISIYHKYWQMVPVLIFHPSILRPLAH